MLAFIYREISNKVVVTELVEDRNTHDLNLPDDSPETRAELWNWLSSMPLNTGIIVDMEINEGTVSNLINLKQFMLPDPTITVEDRAKDSSFVDTLAGVAESLLQDIMNEPRVLH